MMFRVLATITSLLAIAIVATSISMAQEKSNTFQSGEAIPEFGKIAKVQSDVDIPNDVVLKVRFDVARQAEEDQISSTMESVARFINLHAASGLPPNNLQIAIVLHGDAIMDVTQPGFYGIRHDGRKQASVDAVRSLHQHGVKFYVCGQSAAFHKVDKVNLLPVIKVAPSAMTMHAWLAEQGYSLNPF
ncbi:MAG: DsrE family protein [Planctomycetota bacterium]